jgi:hypothetical protein
MLITVIPIVWLATLTLVVCVCRTAAGSEVDGASRPVALASIGEKLVLEHARTERGFAGRRPIQCLSARSSRRLTMRRLRSSAHADS